MDIEQGILLEGYAHFVCKVGIYVDLVAHCVIWQIKH